MCGSMIETGRPRYIFKGELYCAYDGETFDETLDLSKKDFKTELKKLIQQAEKKTEKELMDEVYYNFKLDLCGSCRKKIYDYLELIKSTHPSS